MLDLTPVIAALRDGRSANDLESFRLEFKDEARSLRETFKIITDAAVCMANGDGGDIVLGVRDNPGLDGSIAGVSADLNERVVARAIFDRTQPPLSVSVTEHIEEEKRLLILTVPRGVTIYSNSSGLATRRLGAECRPFSPEEQRQAMAARGFYDWSAGSSGFDLEAIDPQELQHVRDLLSATDRADLSRLDTVQLLHDLRLLNGDDLTRAGLLLLGQQEFIARGIPNYGYGYQYRPSPGREATARLREHRPLLQAVERTIDFVTSRREIHPINVGGGIQIQLEDYSASVVRELVANALIHRDYELSGTVEVEQSPDSLMVSSPGGLVFGVTPENIMSHPSTPRNELLLETVAVLRIAERSGQGVDRVYRELLRNGKKPPDYRDHGTRVVVTVPGGTGDDTFARYVNSKVSSALASDLEALLVLSYLRDERRIDAATLAPLIQRSLVEGQRVLERLTEVAIIEPTRQTARSSNPQYILKPDSLRGLGRAVTYNRRSSRSVDGKIVEHIAEYGHITNQTIRRLFDLDVFAARDLLRDLQQRKVLEKLDDKKSGPGVRYGPGSAFPDLAKK